MSVFSKQHYKVLSDMISQTKRDLETYDPIMLDYFTSLLVNYMEFDNACFKSEVFINASNNDRQVKN